MCYLFAYDKIQAAYEDREISIGDRSITKNATTESLKALGATINFIDICLKLFEDIYDARCVAYIIAMEFMFNKIPLTVIKALTPKQKVQKIMIEIGGGW